MQLNWPFPNTRMQPLCVSDKDMDDDDIEEDEEEVIPSSQKRMRTTGLSTHLANIRIPESPMQPSPESWSENAMDTEDDDDDAANILKCDPQSQMFRKRTSWQSNQRDALWEDVIDANNNDVNSLDDTQMGEVPVVFSSGEIFHIPVHCPQSTTYDVVLQHIRPQIIFSLAQDRSPPPLTNRYLAFQTIPERSPMFCGKKGIVMPNSQSRRFLACFAIENESVQNNDNMDICL